jgi:hypothetical protein
VISRKIRENKNLGKVLVNGTEAKEMDMPGKIMIVGLDGLSKEAAAETIFRMNPDIIFSTATRMKD